MNILIVSVIFYLVLDLLLGALAWQTFRVPGKRLQLPWNFLLLWPAGLYAFIQDARGMKKYGSVRVGIIIVLIAGIFWTYLLQLPAIFFPFFPAGIVVLWILENVILMSLPER
ncbi:hypothetical protein KKF32_00645 [Patescibacteria group bacterium]|nr:hypothetical protein [Patescibacteria group bacterium]